MTDASKISDAELRAEMQRRGLGVGTCSTCHKWQTYTGTYDRDGYTIRCHGCLRAIGRCMCR